MDAVLNTLPRLSALLLPFISTAVQDLHGERGALREMPTILWRPWECPLAARQAIRAGCQNSKEMDRSAGWEMQLAASRDAGESPLERGQGKALQKEVFRVIRITSWRCTAWSRWMGLVWKPKFSDDGRRRGCFSRVWRMRKSSIFSRDG